MAPEFPPRLVVFTLETAGASVKAWIENVESLDPAHLRVRWSEIEAPAGYRAVGAGALYVQDAPGLIIDGPRRVQLEALENDRFRWTQGTPPGIPWIMIAVVFPANFTLGRPTPPPTSAKHFNGRLAVYWCLSGDRLGRAQVEWDMVPLQRSLDDEVRALNSRSSLEDVPAAARIEIEPAAAAAPPRPATVFLCHASEDKPRVRELYAQLKREGFTPWLDAEDLVAGEEWEIAIPNAVRASDVVVVCVSRNILKAGYLQKEITFALSVAEEQPEGAIFVIPLRLDDAPVPQRLSKWQWVDYFEVGGPDRLLRALRKRASQLQTHAG